MPDQELQQIGDTVLRLAKEHPSGGFRFVPFESDVADVWTERHIRPGQSLQLTQEAVREEERAESANPSATRQFIPVIAQGLFHTLTLQMSLAIQLKKFDVAELAVDRMRQYLDMHREYLENRARLDHWYLANAAVLADSEGHKPDDLLYYSEAFQASPEDSSAETHAHQLWKGLGGTEEGFNAWVSAIARMDRTAPGTNEERSPWTAMNKPLTAFYGADTKGKFGRSKT